MAKEKDSSLSLSVTNETHTLQEHAVTASDRGSSLTARVRAGGPTSTAAAGKDPTNHDPIVPTLELSLSGPLSRADWETLKRLGDAAWNGYEKEFPSASKDDEQE